MDWKTIILGLSASGLTQAEIAKYCGCGQSTISELLRGEIRDPAYRIGSRLIELYQSTASSSRHDAARAHRTILPPR